MKRGYNHMEKIASFQVNHLDLLPGIYVSRVDYVAGNPVTTYDLRFKRPNKAPVMNTAEIHAIEHIAATYLRNHPLWKDETVYFGPMGCRTGFYLILQGDRTSKEIVPLITELFEFVADFEGEVPGATPRDCGNYLDINLPMAKYEARQYVDKVLKNIDDAHLIYPE